MTRAAKLYIFSGLPGVGKSTLAQKLASRIGAAYLRIDTIEQALRDLYQPNVEGEGYRLAYRVAADQLRLGISVVADSCNPIDLTRREWEVVAAASGAEHVNIEVICSDGCEHRKRVETRGPTVSGLKLPSWADVEQREYHAWRSERIVIDTSGSTAAASFEELLAQLSARHSGSPSPPPAAAKQ